MLCNLGKTLLSEHNTMYISSSQGLIENRKKIQYISYTIYIPRQLLNKTQYSYNLLFSKMLLINLIKFYTNEWECWPETRQNISMSDSIQYYLSHVLTRCTHIHPCNIIKHGPDQCTCVISTTWALYYM